MVRKKIPQTFDEWVGRSLWDEHGTPVGKHTPCPQCDDVSEVGSHFDAAWCHECGWKGSLTKMRFEYLRSAWEAGSDVYLDRFERLFKIIGMPDKCKSCDAPIIWIVNPKTGKPMPYTPEGLSHFVDCPDAEKFRRGR